MAYDVTSDSFARDICSPHGLRCHERIVRSRHSVSISMSRLEISPANLSPSISVSHLEDSPADLSPGDPMFRLAISPADFSPDTSISGLANSPADSSLGRHSDAPAGKSAGGSFARHFDFSVRYARSQFFARDIHSPCGRICHERIFRSRHPLAIWSEMSRANFSLATFEPFFCHR